MFPIDKRVAQMVWYPAADVIPQLIHALDEVPEALWNAQSDLHELADAIEPALKKHGARKWDFIWSMERHFSEPYGPLPKASIGFMAGIPDIFLKKNETANDGVEVKVKPLQFEAGSALPDGYRRHDKVDRALFHMLADRFGVYQGFEWVRSSYAPLARASLQVVKDERGHSNYGYLHVRDALERDSSIRPALQARVDDFFYPMFMASFGSANSENNRMWRQWGLKLNSNDTLRAAYHSEMQWVLDSLDMRAPDMQASLAKGMQHAADQSAAKTVHKVAN